MNAVNAQARDIEALIEAAYRLYRLNQFEEALDKAHQAVSVAPSNPHCLNARGMIFGALGREQEALADFDSAVSIRPDFADAINNRGAVYARCGRFEQALACYEHSLSLAPHQIYVRYNCSTARLALGDWLRGFREFESRWDLFPHEALRFKRLAPQWLGDRSIAGKTLLLHHEQGFGDTLQFSRYAPLVAQLGARVIVAVPGPLRALMTTLPGTPQIVTEREAIPAHDYSCGLMSLPLAFRTTPDTVPVCTPYLRADPGRAEAWRVRLGESPMPRIGLVWTGRRYPPINHPRDMALEILRPLLSVQAHFVALQPELSVAERELLSKLPNVSLQGEGLKDFADTAALVENLDLVICVDTAVAHLAGALGKPVWVMNRFASCWRWLQRRLDSPWYPTLRLFRQRSLGDWTPVVREVREAAEEFVATLQSDRKRDLNASRSNALCTQAEVITALNAALADHRAGHVASAVEAYRSILQVHPEVPEVQHYLGVALAQTGRNGEAVTFLSAALKSQPPNATLHTHYGNVLADLGQHEAALESYDRAIALDKESADAHYNRASAVAALGRLQEAVEDYQRAISLNPDYVKAYNNLGNMFLELGRPVEAEQSYQEAIRCEPTYVDGWVNCANAQRRLHRYEDALASSERAISLAPTCALAHVSQGAALACLGRCEQALVSQTCALDLQPELADALWNKAIAHLSRGELRAGWSLYEARWRVKSLGLKQYYPTQCPWLGREPLEGKRILLHAEQGYGDTLQFCRYATLVARLGAHVLLGVPSALRALMGSLEGVAEVISQGDLPSVDYHSPLLSMPLAFGTDLSNIPTRVPYLSADVGRRKRWRERLGGDGQLHVGLAWSGRPSHSNDANRSIALETLRPLARGDIRFVSLQKEVRPVDQSMLEQWPEIQRIGEELTDFADTAALISELDLVITVDTAVAHLTGALGKPVWILLPFVADWRWLQGRGDSPWYPTARLYRQAVAGDWRSAIDRVTDDLCRLRTQDTRN